MNRFLGKAANIGMVFLCLLIAANGILSYSYLQRLLADVRRADQANADLIGLGEILQLAAELNATAIAYGSSGDPAQRTRAQDLAGRLAIQLRELTLARPAEPDDESRASLGRAQQQGQAFLASLGNLLRARDERAAEANRNGAMLDMELRELALGRSIAALRNDSRDQSERWLQESVASQNSAKVSLVNATTGALVLLGAVFALVRRDGRERLIAEQRLRREEARFRRLVESDVMGVLIAEIDGRVTEANDTFLKMIGYSRDDLLAGRINWRSLTPAIWDEFDQSALVQLAAKGVAQPYEKQFLKLNGGLAPVLLGCARVDPARDDMICYAIDLSQSKAAEALIQRLNRELQDRVHELETLFELTPVGLALAKDRECRSIAVNGEMAKTLRLPSDANASLTAPLEERPTSFRILREGRDVAPDALPMQQVAASGKPIWNQEYDFMLADGATIKVLSNVAPLFDEAGESRGSIGAFIDITERKQLEDDLKAHAEHLLHQQQWLRALLDLLPVPLLLIEPTTAKITFANRAAHAIAGGQMSLDVPVERYQEVYQCSDIQGRPLSNDEMPGVRVARGERLDDLEINWTVAGVTHALMISADTLTPMHGHDAVAVLMFSEISHLKEIESELMRINQAKDALLTMLGHELRNPLAAISGAAELVAANRPEAAIYRQSLDVLHRQTRHLSRLIDDLLDLSRLTAGKVRLRLQTVDLAQSLRDAVQTVEGLIRKRDHELNIDFADDTMFVEGDATRLEQIFSNLLHNAAKFTEPGGKIELRAGIEGKQVVTRIRDNGVGLDPAVIPRLFELFTQINPRLDRTDTGLGIGLTVVRSLVELHGGRVWANSAGVDHGSEFVVELPCSSARPAPPRAKATASAPPRPLSVLIVEDQPDIGHIMQALLERYGHHPHWVASAAEALELTAKDVLPDVAFVDIGLPVMNGYELAKQLRANPRFERTMLIALTGYGQQEDRERSKEAGFTYHLVKPIDSETLLRMLAECGRRLNPREGADIERPTAEAS